MKRQCQGTDTMMRICKYTNSKYQKLNVSTTSCEGPRNLWCDLLELYNEAPFNNNCQSINVKALLLIFVILLKGNKPLQRFAPFNSLFS